ncbi:MAG: hypothetical protein IJV61_08295 [Paludibacteraceae bacterium]|nr:hypothetical protein [Paludibacteraceae bacterium]
MFILIENFIHLSNINSLSIKSPITRSVFPTEREERLPPRKVLLNHQLPITNYQSPITNYQSPITNHQLPITNSFDDVKTSFHRQN